MGHTTRHLQHPCHHRHVRHTNVTPQRPETTPSLSTPPATPHTPIRHPRHAHQPSPRHQRHQHYRRRRQRQQLTHQLTTINHSPAPTSSTLTPIPPSPTTPPPTQSSTLAPTPPSPPTSPPPPQGQDSRETERQSEHATTRTRRPPYRTPLRNRPPPASPDRACAPAHCWEDDYDVLPAIRHLLAATAPRPQAHQQPTEPQEPDHAMPPRSISPASSADQNAEHQREEPDCNTTDHGPKHRVDPSHVFIEISNYS